MRLRLWLVALATLALLPHAAHGQGHELAPTPIVVVIRDARTAVPIEGVTLSIDGKNAVAGAPSDQFGRITLTTLLPGKHVFEASRAGYKTTRSEANLSGQAADTVWIAVAPVLLADLVQPVSIEAMADSGTRVPTRQDSLGIIEALAEALDSAPPAIGPGSAGVSAASADSLLAAALTRHSRGPAVSRSDGIVVHVHSLGTIGDSAATASLVLTRCVDGDWLTGRVIRYALVRTTVGWIVVRQGVLLTASGVCRAD